jgi:hypothetical protein
VSEKNEYHHRIENRRKEVWRLINLKHNFSLLLAFEKVTSIDEILRKKRSSAFFINICNVTLKRNLCQCMLTNDQIFKNQMKTAGL